MVNADENQGKQAMTTPFFPEGEFILRSSLMEQYTLHGCTPFVGFSRHKLDWKNFFEMYWYIPGHEKIYTDGF